MRGYACANCGAKSKEKLQPPNVSKKLCPMCGKPLIVKMSVRKTEVIAYFPAPKHKDDSG